MNSKLLIVIFFLSSIIASSPVLFAYAQDLEVPEIWHGCQDVSGNVNTQLSNINSTSVFHGFWFNLLGTEVGEIRHFIVGKYSHPYTNELHSKDLYYIVKIESISNGSAVLYNSTVDILYSLYTDCIVENPLIGVEMQKIEWIVANNSFFSYWETATIFRFYSLFAFSNPTNISLTKAFPCMPADWYVNISVSNIDPNYKVKVPNIGCPFAAFSFEEFPAGVSKKVVYGEIAINHSSLSSLPDGDYSFFSLNSGLRKSGLINYTSSGFMLQNETITITVLGNSTSFYHSEQYTSPNGLSLIYPSIPSPTITTEESGVNLTQSTSKILGFEITPLLFIVFVITIIFSKKRK